MSQKENNNMDKHFYRASAADFNKIPGSPIAYWPSQRLRDCFSDHKSLAEVAKPRQGLATTDNERFLKFWFECSGKTQLSLIHHKPTLNGIHARKVAGLENGSGIMNM
jgi:hypothetical protein